MWTYLVLITSKLKKKLFIILQLNPKETMARTNEKEQIFEFIN